MAHSPPRVWITSEFHIDAAHLIDNHPGKCRRLHGHTYRIEVVVEVARDHVGVGPIGPRAAWHREPALPRDSMNSFRQLLRERTVGNLATDLPDLRRLQRVVEPSQ